MEKGVRGEHPDITSVQSLTMESEHLLAVRVWSAASYVVTGKPSSEAGLPFAGSVEP